MLVRSVIGLLVSTVVGTSAFAGTHTCQVRQQGENGESTVISSTVVDLTNRSPSLVLVEGETAYGASLDQEGHMQLSVFKPMKKEIIALAVGPNDQWLMVAHGQPVRQFNCFKN